MGPVMHLWVAMLAPGMASDGTSDAAPYAIDDTFEARAGFALIDLAVPVAPPIPVFTGDIAWHHRMASWLTLGARYRTHLGAINRLGPEARVALPLSEAWTVGARIYASASLAGAWQDGLDAAGDISTAGVACLEWHHGMGTMAWDAITVEGGLTVEWLLWEAIAGRSALDVAPYPAYAEAAVEWRHGLHAEAWLTLRGDVSAPLDLDPYAPWGIYPRLTFGGGFGW